MAESPERSSELPGMAESYWLATSPETAFPPLGGDGQADVTVIGGGIVGVTTAFLLKRAGLTVILVDAYRIVTGTTGHTTAKVTSLHQLIYADLIDRFGSTKARQYADANQAAIETVASLVREYAIPCNFERKPAYTFAESADDREKVATEADAAKTSACRPRSPRKCRSPWRPTERCGLPTRRSSTRETTSCCSPGTSPEREASYLR